MSVTLTGTNSKDVIVAALAVVHHISGLGGDDTLTGAAANDTLVGGAGNDRLDGGEGDDTFLRAGAAEGFDSFIGGTGIDTVLGSAGDDVIGVRGTGLTGIETIDGGGGLDTLLGGAGNDIIDLRGVTVIGIDSIVGGAGNDSLFGGEGDDTLVGGAGNDRIDGGEGDDTFLRSGSAEGFDSFIGGAGFDTILGSAGDDVIGVRGTGLTGIETIDGGGGLDTLLGGTGNDIIDLRPITAVGIVSVAGGAGNDSLFGGAGDDTLVGGAGNDRLDGGEGDDTFLRAGSAEGFDSFIGGAGLDTVLGTAGNDVIGVRGTGLTGIETIDGGGGLDTLLGGSGNDIIDLRGTTVTGIVSVAGGAGRDSIFGGAGDDFLVGGTGNDRLDGGAGEDTAAYTGLFGSYVLTTTATGFTINGIAVGDGVDTLVSIERIAFADGVFAGGVFSDPTNLPPTPDDDTASVAEDGSVAIDVLANDDDPDGHPLTVQAVTQPTLGTAVIGAGGTITYTPFANANGADSFTYTVSDGRGGLVEARVDVDITPVNDAPVAATDIVTTPVDTPLTFDPRANDSDVDGDGLAISGTVGPSHGSLVVNPDGTVTYQPDAGFAGTDLFTYTLSDGNGGNASATAFVSVIADPPPTSLFFDRLLATPEMGWVQLNVNAFSDAFPDQAQRPDIGSYSNPTRIIQAWSSVAWNPNDDSLIAWGGGHANYAGNDVYVWESSTLSWTRGSLTSDIALTGLAVGHYNTVDGVDAAPVSAHTYDNNEFLPLANRFVTLGGAAFNTGGGFSDASGTRAGPYFWNPDLADPDKVGGATGSHTNPALFPDVVGGNMWQNRDHWAPSQLAPGESAAGGMVNGTTAYAFENGKEVLYVTEAPTSGGDLHRYIINDPLDPTQDRWERVGGGNGLYGGQGAGAYDQGDQVYVRTTQTGFVYWDTSGGVTTGKLFTPTSIGAAFTPGVNYGMDFDPIRGDFVLWDGFDDVWRLNAPDVLNTTGWTIEKDTTAALTPPSGSVGTGVLGKWKYVADYDVFIGVTNVPNAGDVWAYKPANWQPSVGGASQDGYTAIASAADGAAPPPAEIG